MTDDAQRLRAELEALYPYVEERETLVEERDLLEVQLSAAQERIAELTYQRDRVRWRLDALKSRRFLRAAAVVSAAIRAPRRLLRLPLDLFRTLTRPTTYPPEPTRPDVAVRRRTDRATADDRSPGELARRYLTPARPEALQDLRVAAIMDTFSASCFAPECRLLTFRPDNWRATLEATPPHLLLVESAWQGNDGAWQYQVGSYSYPDSIGLPHLTSLVEWCRDHDVPTVFWNKEDPVHFDKFKEAAQLFDVVLTTDADRIPAYHDLPDLRARVVDALPFAAQPTLHNPVGSPAHREAVPVFAGTYYRTRHEARREQLEMLLDAAVPFGLRIFDRMHGQESETVGYPDRFAEHISGGLPYDEMVETYKRYRVFLNTNSVTESPTMFSRRVFELLASGTPVVSTPSAGMTRMLGDVLDVVDDRDSAAEAIAALLEDDTHWRDRSRAGIRAVMREHTYRHRLATVAEHAGLDVTVRDVGVTVIALDDGAAPMLHHDLAHGGGVDEVLVGTRRDDVTAGHPTVTRVPQHEEGQRDRFRDLAGRAGTPWLLLTEHVAEVDRELLDDLRGALHYTDADVLGRAADGSRHRYVTDLRPLPALVRRDLVARHGWTTDADAGDALFAGLVAAGHRLFAVDTGSDSH